MKIITLDFETYWDSDYTLSKLTPLEYVLGERYETISCTIMVDGEEPVTYFGDVAIAAALARLPTSESALLAHNMLGFDAYICAYRFKLRPRVWLDTLAMARPVHAKQAGGSLKALVQHYELGIKDDTILHATKGKYLADFTTAELRAMELYNKNDVTQCRALFDKLRPYTNANELWQIDLTTRMRTEPQFELDQDLMTTTLAAERAKKSELLLQIADIMGYPPHPDVEKLAREILASQAKFKELLQKLQVEVPMKPSPTSPEKQIPALAKSDQGFLDLQDHENEVVSIAARARLAIKSTLLETRIEKLLIAARLAEGKLPVPIRYAGADTTGRDSGEEYNMLNLPRVNPRKPKLSDALRCGLLAPRGKVVLVADQSNIELRVNHTLWNVESSIELWKQNPDADLYRAFAAARYGIAPADVSEDQRQLAKVAQLGLGFGAGAPTFRRVARLMSDGALQLSQEEAEDVVFAWRSAYAAICGGWRISNNALGSIYRGDEFAIDPRGLCLTSAEGIVLPGYTIRYPKLRQERDDSEKMQWVYGEGRHKARIYGPKVVENIVQSLARQTIMDATIEFFRRTGLRPALRPYDELVYIVDEAAADDLLAELLAVLRTPPRWWPDLRVWAKGGYGKNYGVAKG